MKRETPFLLDVARLGQVFTPDFVVDRMLALRQRRGSVLEPSCGAGAFASKIPGVEALELDGRCAWPGAVLMDFFDLPVAKKYETIIGNPPYVKFRDILSDTRGKLPAGRFDARTNLFIFFLDKCLDHLAPLGEMIMIVPRELATLTCARRLNERLTTEGAITHWEETGDAPVFSGAAPNCVIFRFEKGAAPRPLPGGRAVHCIGGRLAFDLPSDGILLSDFFEVRVGAVSGCDEVFASAGGDMEFVCSRTRASGELRRMITRPHPALEAHRGRLLARRIRRFTESNWWEWGRWHHVSDAPRIYVNAKTRQKQPFFVHECLNYDGSVLALFPRDPRADVAVLADALNGIDWAAQGFVCDGRLLFGQRSLSHAILPVAFKKII